MHQERKETKEYFFEQLKTWIPVRTRITSQKRLEKLSQMMDFDPIINFLETNSLNLKWAELPRSYGFKTICYFVLLNNRLMAYYADDKIFDLSDELTAQKLKEVKEYFSHDGEVSTIPLEKFYLNSISRKPNW